MFHTDFSIALKSKYICMTCSQITPLNQLASSLHRSPYTSLSADKENLFNNQELLLLAIISFILVRLMCDSGMILYDIVCRN